MFCSWGWTVPYGVLGGDCCLWGSWPNKVCHNPKSSTSFLEKLALTFCDICGHRQLLKVSEREQRVPQITLEGARSRDVARQCVWERPRQLCRCWFETFPCVGPGLLFLPDKLFRSHMGEVRCGITQEDATGVGRGRAQRPWRGHCCVGRDGG